MYFLGLASLSGVLLVLSFPHFGNAAVAWVALCPLLVAVARATRWQALRLGLVAGIVHFTGTLYWIPAVMVNYGGLPPVAAWPVHALLVAYLALFPALFALAMADLTGRFGPAGLLLAPAVWVTTELGRIYLFTGFPWALVGYSQVPFPAVAQVASLAGVLGVSALVLLVNATLAHAVTAGPRAARMPAAIAAAAVTAALAFGAWRLQDGALLSEGVPLRVAALQGNVAQDEKWNPLRSDEILEIYLEQTARAAASGAHLIVWPESATPFPLERDPRRSRFATRRGAPAHTSLSVRRKWRRAIPCATTTPPTCWTPAVRPSPSTASSTSFRSVSTFRCGRLCSSFRRSSTRWPISPRARGLRCCPWAGSR